MHESPAKDRDLAPGGDRALTRAPRTGSCRASPIPHHSDRATAATWLRRATGDTRLVAEYLGHADLSTVSRYTHVASEEMHAAVQTLADEARVSAPDQLTPPAARTPKTGAKPHEGTRRRASQPGARGARPGSTPGRSRSAEGSGIPRCAASRRALPGFSRAPAPSDSIEIALVT
jgi:hypothetical protein